MTELSPNNSKPEAILVVGAAGIYASKHAGWLEVAERLVSPVKIVASSSGCIPAVAMAVGMDAVARRRMNVEAPMAALTDSPNPDGTSPLRLGGRYAGKALPKWLNNVVTEAGHPTWGDVAYASARPELGPYRLTVTLSSFVSRRTYRNTTQEQLDNPRFAQSVLSQILRDKIPVHDVKTLFFPDNIVNDFPWLAETIDKQPVAEAIGWSCLRWPFYIPKLLKNPINHRVHVLFDGATLWGQPNQFNTPTAPPLPLINVRFGLGNNRNLNREHEIDQGGMPWAYVQRLRTPKAKSLDLDIADRAVREAMYEQGVQEGEEVLPNGIGKYLSWFDAHKATGERFTVFHEERTHIARQLLQSPTDRPTFLTFGKLPDRGSDGHVGLGLS